MAPHIWKMFTWPREEANAPQTVMRPLTLSFACFCHQTLVKSNSTHSGPKARAEGNALLKLKALGHSRGVSGSSKDGEALKSVPITSLELQFVDCKMEIVILTLSRMKL